MRKKLSLLVLLSALAVVPSQATVMSLAIAANEVANGNLQQLGPAGGAIGIVAWAELLARFFVL